MKGNRNINTIIKNMLWGWFQIGAMVRHRAELAAGHIAIDFFLASTIYFRAITLTFGIKTLKMFGKFDVHFMLWCSRTV